MLVRRPAPRASTSESTIAPDIFGEDTLHNLPLRATVTVHGRDDDSEPVLYLADGFALYAVSVPAGFGR